MVYLFIHGLSDIRHIKDKNGLRDACKIKEIPLWVSKIGNEMRTNGRPDIRGDAISPAQAASDGG